MNTAKRFTEIIAKHLDVKDQLMGGVGADSIEHERWRERYLCRMPTNEGIEFIVPSEFNREVNSVVSALLHASEEGRAYEIHNNLIDNAKHCNMRTPKPQRLADLESERDALLSEDKA